MGLNEERAKRALRALRPYLKDNDEREAIIDLMADLMHAYGATIVGGAVRIARDHYKYEQVFDRVGTPIKETN